MDGFVSMLVQQMNFNLVFYLFEGKEPLFYVKMNENDMHEHKSSACSKRTLSFILSL